MSTGSSLRLQTPWLGLPSDGLAKGPSTMTLKFPDECVNLSANRLGKVVLLFVSH